MTFADLRDSLKAFAPDDALVFEDAGGPIAPGYHVTELRHSASTGIDCGGNVSTWSEARLQLLDGHGGDYMTVGTFLRILEKSLERLPDLTDAPLLVEYGSGNRELKLLRLGRAARQDGKVSLPLTSAQAICKPAARHLNQSATPRAPSAQIVGKETSCGPQKSTACCA